MILSEMLEHTGKDYLDDRVEILEGDADELFSDAVLVRHFNEAQRILTRRSWVITETGKAPAGTLILQTGKTIYTLHPSVLRVESAIPSDTEIRLARVVDEALDTRPLTDPEAPFDINVAETSTPGYPRAFATDSGTRQLRIYPAPAAAQAGLKINLKVRRMPITWLTLDDVDAHPEVPEDWHEALCKYAAGMCLTAPKSGDIDARVQGRRYLDEFYADVRLARQERERAERAPIKMGFCSTTAVL